MVVDLKNAQEREALLRICDSADVFVESFRPGVVERLGVGYEQLRARNPRIVYCSISAFGQSGPMRERPAHDLAVEALSGVLSIGIGQDAKPAIPGLPLADLLASLHGLAGVLMALLRREETGKGDYLDMAMADCLLACLPNNMGVAMTERRQLDPKSERTLGGNALYNLYETKDGDFVVLGGQELKFAKNLLEPLGRPDLVELCKLPPGPGQDPVRAFLRDTFRTKTKAEWVAWFKGRDIAFAPVKTLPEVLEDSHFKARGMVLKDGRGWDHLGVPIAFRDEPARPRFEAPAHGQHSRAILRTLGYAEAEIAALKAAGVIKGA